MTVLSTRAIPRSSSQSAQQTPPQQSFERVRQKQENADSSSPTKRQDGDVTEDVAYQIPDDQWKAMSDVVMTIYTHREPE